MIDEFGNPPQLDTRDPNAAYMVWLGSAVTSIWREQKRTSQRMDQFEEFKLKEERHDNTIIDLEEIRLKKAKERKDRIDQTKRYFEIAGICVAIVTAINVLPSLSSVKEMLF